VVGAVGRLLRVERCERLQLVAAATRICIATCHDCVFYVGVNRPPLLIGDNRFLQARTPLPARRPAADAPAPALAPACSGAEQRAPAGAWGFCRARQQLPQPGLAAVEVTRNWEVRVSERSPPAPAQMAPYNTQYERLAVHLAAAGVSAEPNLWDSPVTLAREHRRATPDSEATSVPGARPPCGHSRR